MKYLLIETIIFLIFSAIVFYYRKKHPRPKPFLSDVKNTFQKAIKGDIFSIIFILSLIILALIIIACYSALLEEFLPY